VRWPTASASRKKPTSPSSQQIHDQLGGACASAVTALADAGRVATPVDLQLEAGRLHALVDGLAVQATPHPAKLPAPQVVAVLARHLDSPEPRP
jgi:BetI-type transcriptional repressor, C-terminal